MGREQPRAVPRAHSTDAYAPQEIARKVLEIGVAKASLPARDSMALAVLAGAFIGMGAAFSTLTSTGSVLGFGFTRVVAGLAFSLGLILVVVAGAELFTGNNLVAMAWACGAIRTRQLLRNWGLVYIGNLVGSIATALLVLWSGTLAFGDHAVAANAVTIAAAKCQIGWVEAFFRGMLCNALVCLAVWLCHSGRSTTDRVLAVLWPITAFVALGFEHCVANMYFIPLGILLKGRPQLAGIAGVESLDLAGFAHNLVPVTLGNIVGGTLLVAGIYWFVYLRPESGRDGGAG